MGGSREKGPCISYILEAWGKEYNTERPHSTLRMKTPVVDATQWRPPEQANTCS
jgi:hypothetical protein